MAEITTSMVKELRERTQAGMGDCKSALVEAGGDIDKAVEVILKKGIVKAASRAGKVATEGEVRAVVNGKTFVVGMHSRRRRQTALSTRTFTWAASSVF